MPNYRYRALNGNGELVSGAIAASAPGEVAQRIERLGLVLVDNVTLEEGGSARSAFSVFNKPKPEDITLFTRDLALLLRAGRTAVEIAAPAVALVRVEPGTFEPVAEVS